MSDFADLVNRLMPIIEQVASKTIRQTLRQSSSVLVRSGSVTAVTEVDRTCQVLLDVDTLNGGTTTITVQCPDNVPAVSARCLVLLTPPAGAILLTDNPSEFTIGSTTVYRPSATLRDGITFYDQANDITYATNGAAWREIYRLAAWTSYTPTVTQNGARTISNNASRYMVIGTTCFFSVILTITNAGTAGNAISVTLPYAPVRSSCQAGAFRYLDTGTAYYAGSAVLNGTNAEFLMYADDSVNAVGISPSIATANGDAIVCNGFYEIAVPA